MGTRGQQLRALIAVAACLGLAGCSPLRPASGPIPERPISAHQVQSAFLTHEELEKAAGETLTFANATPSVSLTASWFSQASDAPSLSVYCKSLIDGVNAVEPLAAVNIYDSAAAASGAQVTLQATHFKTAASAGRALKLASSFLTECGNYLESVDTVQSATTAVAGAIGLDIRIRAASGPLACTYGHHVNILVFACGPTQTVADTVVRAQYAAMRTTHASAQASSIPPSTASQGTADDLVSRCAGLATQRLPQISSPKWDGAAPVRVSRSGTAITLRGSNGVVTCLKEFGIVQVRGVLDSQTLDSVPADQIERNGRIVLFGGTVELPNGLRVRVQQGQQFTPSAQTSGDGVSMPYHLRFLITATNTGTTPLRLALGCSRVDGEYESDSSIVDDTNLVSSGDYGLLLPGETEVQSCLRGSQTPTANDVILELGVPYGTVEYTSD